MKNNFDKKQENRPDKKSSVCEYCGLDFPKSNKKLCHESEEGFYTEIHDMLFPNGRDYDAEDW